MSHVLWQPVGGRTLTLTLGHKHCFPFSSKITTSPLLTNFCPFPRLLSLLFFSFLSLSNTRHHSISCRSYHTYLVILFCCKLNKHAYVIIDFVSTNFVMFYQHHPPPTTRTSDPDSEISFRTCLTGFKFRPFQAISKPERIILQIPIWSNTHSSTKEQPVYLYTAYNYHSINHFFFAHNVRSQNT